MKKVFLLKIVYFYSCLFFIVLGRYLSYYSYSGYLAILAILAIIATSPSPNH